MDHANSSSHHNEVATHWSVGFLTSAEVVFRMMAVVFQTSLQFVSGIVSHPAQCVEGKGRLREGRSGRGGRDVGAEKDTPLNSILPTRV